MRVVAEILGGAAFYIGCIVGLERIVLAQFADLGVPFDRMGLLLRGVVGSGCTALVSVALVAVIFSLRRWKGRADRQRRRLAKAARRRAIYGEVG